MCVCVCVCVCAHVCECVHMSGERRLPQCGRMGVGGHKQSGGIQLEGQIKSIFHSQCKLCTIIIMSISY